MMGGMTLTCPGPNCPLCTKAACSQCGIDFDHRTCPHDRRERHQTVDPLAPPRTRTRAIEETIELAFPDGDPTEQAALFMESIARMIRMHGEIVVTIRAKQR